MSPTSGSDDLTTPASERPPDYFTMRALFRRVWADKQSKLFIMGVLVLTVLVPIGLALFLPEDTDAGFWLELGHDWVTRGPSALVWMLICTFVILPILLRRRKSRAEAEDLKD